MTNQYYPVLDHGFIALKDYMGSDQDIEEAARTSYGKGTRKKTETRNLLRYLMRHHHSSPFEMAELKFHIGMPIFVCRQLVRHRTANMNELSGRYSIMPDLTYLPSAENIKKQSRANKQGREGGWGEDECVADLTRDNMKNINERSRLHYNGFIIDDVSRELARTVLPLSTYTVVYWKMDLRNLFNFIRLRLDSHAQYEIRVYAEIMAEIVKELFPISFEAFMDYQFNSVSFTLDELDVLKALAKPEDVLQGRELVEFEQKLNKQRISVGDIKNRSFYNAEHYEKIYNSGG